MVYEWEPEMEVESISVENPILGKGGGLEGRSERGWARLRWKFGGFWGGGGTDLFT